VNLSACLDTNVSRSRIEAGRNEAQILDVNKTPTFFVTGRIVVGIRSAQTFYSVVDEALAAAKARE
jgi:predicted DsbA family dithiol-disulfide isomerase